MNKLLADIKYELQRQAFGAPVDKPRVVALIDRINADTRLPEAVKPLPDGDEAGTYAAGWNTALEWSFPKVSRMPRGSGGTQFVKGFNECLAALEARRSPRGRKNLMSEKVYDTEIAPKLKELSELCQKHKMPFVALVEYEPEQCGRTEYAPFESCILMHITVMAARSGGNVDGLFMGIARTCQRKGISTKASFVMQQFTSDAASQGSTERK